MLSKEEEILTKKKKEKFELREETRTERDELITKQEMEFALGLMKSQIVEEIR